MDPRLLQAYTVLGFTMMAAIGIFLLKISGKDMMFAILRHFRPQGNDIFIANSNRNIERHYQVPKDNTFTINGMLYLTNPDKTMGLTDNMIKIVNDKLDKKKKNLEAHIAKLKAKRDIVLKQVEALEGKEENVSLLEQFKLQLAELDNAINTLTSKLKDKEQSYYFQKRGAYFYIEGDPVPKDFYEFFTEMDSVQLQNIILRAQTKDPNNIMEIQRNLLILKKIMIISIIVTGLLMILVFKNGNVIDQLATKAGVTFQL